MHAGEKARTFDAIADCLRNLPVADSLPEGWEKTLLREHRRHLERDRTIGSTVEVEFGLKPGWITVEQAGGGIVVHLWSLEARKCTEARTAMEQLRIKLHATAIHLSAIHVRFTTPHEWASRKGWPIAGAA